MKYICFELYVVLAVTVLSWTGGVSVAADTESTSKKSTSSDDLSYMRGRQKVLEGKLEEALPDLLAALKQDPESATIHHELANAYLRLGRFEDSEGHGKKAVELRPENVEYRSTLAGIFASLKKYDEAKAQYAKVMELDPSNTKVPLLMAILEAESGKAEDAVNTISKFIESNPDSFMAYFYRAKIHLETDQVEKAKSDLEKSLSLRPNFVEAGTALGMIYEKLGDVDGAITAYSKIQSNGRFRKRLGQLYLGKNEYEKALTEFTEYEKLEPEDYTIRLKIGLIHFEMKRYPQALAKFNEILKEQKEDAASVHFYVGLVHEEMKDVAKAIESFKKVPAEASYFKEAMLRLGAIYKEQNKLSEGKTLAKKLLTKYPEVIEFYDLHATFYEASRDYKKALAIIGEGRKQYPTDDKLLYWEGALFDKVGNRAKAIENMNAILAQNPNNPHALNFLGYTYAEMGEKLDEAEASVKKANELRPNDGYIVDSLGWVYFKKGDLAKAEETLNKAREMQPEEPVILEHLGDLFLKKKEVDKAVAYYREAIALNKKKKDVAAAKKLESKVVAANKEKRAPTGSSGQ